MNQNSFSSNPRGTKKIRAIRRVQSDQDREPMVDWATALSSYARGSFHMVKIILDDSQTTFFANEALIRANSVFFNTSLCEMSPWDEAQTKPARFLHPELYRALRFYAEKTVTLYGDICPRQFRIINWWTHISHRVSDKALAHVLGAKILLWVKVWVLADYLLMPVLQNRITKLLVKKFAASFSAERPGFKPFRVHRDAINFVYENTFPNSCLQKLFTEFIAYSIPTKALWASKRPNKRIMTGFPQDVARPVLARVNQRASSLHHVGLLHDFPEFIDPAGYALRPVRWSLANLRRLCRKWYQMFEWFRVPDDAPEISQEYACHRAYCALSSPYGTLPLDCYAWYCWLFFIGMRIGEIAKDNPRVERLLWRYVASHNIAVVWVRDLTGPSARLPTHDSSGLSLRDEYDRVFGITFARWFKGTYNVVDIDDDDAAPNPFVLGRHWRNGLQSLDNFVDLHAFSVDERR